MKIEDAFIEFTQSETYKETAKLSTNEGSRYRNWLYRFNKGQMKAGGIVEILQDHGYEVIVLPKGYTVVKNKTAKKKK